MNITTYKSSDMRRALCMGGLLSMLCVMPMWADPDIANNVTTPSCDDSVLESDTGPVNIEIDWAPNHITLNWYEDSSATTPMTVGTASQSCDYNETNGTLVVPSAPAARTGYTFKGWRVRCSFASSRCGLTGTTLDSLTSTGYGYTRLNGNVGENENTYGLTTGSGEWAASFSNGGVVKGIASCNNNKPDSYDTVMAGIMNGTIPMDQAVTMLYSCSSDALRPAGTFNSSSTGLYCWCKMTSYTPSGGPQCDTQVSTSWVFTNERGTASDCATNCALDCGVSVPQNIGSFRRVLFGVER